MNQAITVYLSHENLPTGSLRELRCINCGRLFMQVSRAIVAITNTQGLILMEIPIGMGYIEQKCRGCAMSYRVLLQ